MKSNIFKALILGMGITFLSSGVAFASTEEAKPTVGLAEDSVIMSITGSAPDEIDPQAPILYTTDGASGNSSVSITQYQVDEGTLKKQSEIDQYLFEQHKAEIAEKGIFVTHTSPNGSIVEIGIEPYTDANAEYLYSIFGKDVVKVVEGQDSRIFETAPIVDGEIRITSEPVTDQIVTDVKIISAPASDDIKITSATGSAENALVNSDKTLTTTLTYSLGALIVLGSVALFMRKKAIANKR